MAAPQPRLSVTKEWDEATLALAKAGFSPSDVVGYVATITNTVTDLDVTITDVFPTQLDTVTWELLDSDDMVVASGSGDVSEAYTLLADEAYTLVASGTIAEDLCEPYSFTNVVEVLSDAVDGECVFAFADSPTSIVGDSGELTFCLDAFYRYANVTNDALGALLVSQASAARLADLVNNGGSLEDLGGSGGGVAPPAVTCELITVADAGATYDVSFAECPNSRIYDLTMTEALALSFAAFAGDVGQVTVYVRGAFPLTIDAAAVWTGGAPQAYADYTVYEFLTIDQATTVESGEFVVGPS